MLPSLGETSVEQRAAETPAPARGLRIAEPSDVATPKGSGRTAALLERLLRARVGAPSEPVEIVADRVTVVVRAALGHGLEFDAGAVDEPAAIAAWLTPSP